MITQFIGHAESRHLSVSPAREPHKVKRDVNQTVLHQCVVVAFGGFGGVGTTLCAAALRYDAMSTTGRWSAAAAVPQMRFKKPPF